MLIRVSGGDSGVEDYLEHGQKQGRVYSRDELDERVILDGDLDTIRLINESNNSQGEKYLHITLSFKEDEINNDMLLAITNDFKEFACSAYEPDEYAFYAEAHLPKIKSYIHSKTGEFVERKPHIHIVIPEKNLLSGTHLNPFGKVEQQTQFIDAFQELTNAKYGLSSPKDNRRTGFNLESEMVSRYKGDEFMGREVFTGHHKDLKAQLLADILDKDITTPKDFAALLAGYGEVKTRNAGKHNEYLNIKPDPNEKGVNLKEFVFSKDFLSLPAEQKRQELAKAAHAEYQAAGQARATPAEYQAILQEWHDTRAKEVKYLNSGNRKLYTEYKQASLEERAAILENRKNHFYTKHRAAEHDNDDKRRIIDRIRDNIRTVDRHIQSAGRIARNLDQASGNLARRRTFRAIAAVVERLTGNQGRVKQGQGYDPLKTDREADNTVGQLKRDQQEKQTTERSAELSEFQEIRLHLDARRLLDSLSHSHGVIPEKYPLSKAKDGGDRIKAGNRNLNVSDFLTKELNLPWSEAAKIMRATYQEQTGRTLSPSSRNRPGEQLWDQFRVAMKNRPAQNKALWEAQKEKEAAQRKAIKEVFYAKRGRIQGDRSLSASQRKAKISIARMERIEQEQGLREAIKTQRAELKKSLNKPVKDEYLDWLTDRAGGGNAEALTELRRMQAKTKEKTGEQEIHSGSDIADREEAPLLSGRLSYQVHRDGAVTYRRGKADVVRDEGRFVKVLQTEASDIETGLRLAQAKFGRVLDVQGDADFKRQTALVAAEKGLNVEFTDKGMNETMKARKAHLAETKARDAELRALARAEMQKAKTAKTEKPQVGAKEKTPERPKAEQAQEKPAPTMESRRQEAIKEAAQLTGRELIEKRPGEDTRHTGKVVHITETHVVQSISRNEVIAHELSQFPERPDLEAKPTIEYSSGQIARVTNHKVKEQSREHEGPSL
ncbi:MAG: LPD7 domain-containing protein [Methylobacter sp.]